MVCIAKKAVFGQGNFRRQDQQIEGLGWEQPGNL